MKINTSVTIEELNAVCSRSLVGEMSIHFTEIGDESLSAEMEITDKHKQPFGLLHGGMNCVLGETLGGALSALYIDVTKQLVFGQTISTNHLKAATSGTIQAVATPIKIGKSTHTVKIDTYDDLGDITSTTTLVNAIRDRRE